MEDDEPRPFDDTVDERFYDERRERTQRRLRKRYHAVYVAPRWSLPRGRSGSQAEDSDDDGSDDGQRQHRGLLLCGVYERKQDADAAAGGVGALILRMFRGTDARDGSWSLAHSLPAEILDLVRSYGCAGDIELRSMGTGLQRELRSCCAAMLERERQRYAESLQYMTPTLVLKALKVAGLTPVMSCFEACVILRDLRQEDLEVRLQEAVDEAAKIRELHFPPGVSESGELSMVCDQLDALVEECEAEVRRRADGGTFSPRPDPVGPIVFPQAGEDGPDGRAERLSLRAILTDRNLIKLDTWLRGKPQPALLARLLHQEKKFAMTRNDESDSDDDEEGVAACSLTESSGTLCSVFVAPVAAPRGAQSGPLYAVLGRHDECGNGEGDDDKWRSRVLGLAFGDDRVRDAVRDELLYGVKDELMGNNDWWGGMVLAPNRPWPNRVDAEAPHSVLSFYEDAVDAAVLFGDPPSISALGAGRALRAALPENHEQELPAEVFGGVAFDGREYAMPSFPAGPRGDMHDMAQPFFVWARHGATARGYLFGSDPHECFVDNFLTWAEPVRFHPKPKPAKRRAAKPATRKRRKRGGPG